MLIFNNIYNMRNKFLKFYLLFALIVLLQSCQVITDIFQAGVWVGVIIVIAVIALIIYIVAKARRRG